MVVLGTLGVEWLVDFPDNGIRLHDGNDAVMLKGFSSKGWLLQDGQTG